MLLKQPRSPEERYFEEIESFFTENGRGLCREVFERYRTEFMSIVKQELAKPTLGNRAGEISELENLGNSVTTMLRDRYGDRPLKVLLMPAGVYAQDIAEKISSESVSIQAFLDNGKTGATEKGGKKICRPDDAATLEHDAIVLATPSYGAQQSMFSQLADITGRPEDIIMTGDLLLSRKTDWLLDSYDSLAEQKSQDIHAIINGGKTVVFAVPSFPAHYIGHVNALRRKGIKTVLISLGPEIMYGPSVSEFGRAFDYACTLDNNLLAFFALIRKLEGCSLYAVDYSLFNWLALMIRDLFSGKMVLEVYDLSDNAGFSKGPGVRNVEKQTGFDVFALDNESRQIVYDTVDGIIFRDSPVLMDNAKTLWNISTPTLRFLPYPECCDSLKELDGEEHIVFSGHILNAPNELVYTVLNLSKEVAAQGIHMHFFNPADPMGTALPDFIQAAEQSPYIHYHRPVAAEFHNQIMRLYNWGWLVYDFSRQSREDIERHAYTFTSRLLSYVNAGLPVICSEESSYQVDVIRETGIGLIVGRRDIPRLRDIIVSCDYDAMVDNVMALRQSWDINEKMSELIPFVF